MSNKHTGELDGASDYLKAQYIRRWGIVNTAKQQSIAEHMYGVWLLIRLWGPSIDLASTSQEIAEEWALTHDLAEIRTGDMPTPHKTPEIKNWLERVEHSIYLPIKLTEANIKDTVVADFCKFCDTAEAILFLQLNGVGRHAMDVRDVLQLQMIKRLQSSKIADSQQIILLKLFHSALETT
jgi:hypothetical protein